MKSAREKPRVGYLRLIREMQGRSLRSVAHEAGLDPGQLSRIETGQQRASVDQLIALGRVLGIADLVGLERYREWPE
jgi:transcriptional regulator with XRE-family HTH domain